MPRQPHGLNITRAGAWPGIETSVSPWQVWWEEGQRDWQGCWLGRQPDMGHVSVQWQGPRVGQCVLTGQLRVQPWALPSLLLRV